MVVAVTATADSNTPALDHHNGDGSGSRASAGGRQPTQVDRLTHTAPHGFSFGLKASLSRGCPFTGPVELGRCAGFDLGGPRRRRRVGLIFGL